MRAVRSLEIEEWLDKSLRDLVDCPHQPGNLKISQSTCIKRYRLAQVMELQAVHGEDDFNRYLNTGLSLCRECPMVKYLLLHGGLSNDSKIYPKQRGLRRSLQ